MLNNHSFNPRLLVMKGSRTIFKSGKSGLRPLIEFTAKFRGKVQGCTVFDKVIGLAAARLIIHSGTAEKAVTKTCSVPAKKLLLKHKIHLEAKRIVTNVLNMDKTAVCPMETMARFMTNSEFSERMLAKIKKY